jgi:Ig-like domain from next to BRCA1 gene
MDRLAPGRRLTTGEELTSTNGRVRLVLQGDGNLVLYRTDDGRPLWASETWRQPVRYAIMQPDGNLVAYSTAGQPYWAAGTQGHPGARLVLQDDGNLVIYDAGGSALWASNTVQWFGPQTVPGFRPSTNAPLFSNATGWPAGTRLALSVRGLPPVSIDVTRMGLCGGMSFLTRDIFESGTPQLRGRTSQRIPVAVAQHILNRLLDSFDGPATVARWLAVTQALDHDTPILGRGLFHQTVAGVPDIIADIDAGRLCPVGLVLTQSYAPWAVFNNHVVLVWGYERSGDILTLRTYDSNLPGDDDIVVQLDISSPTAVRTITTNGTDGPEAGTVRGFFRLEYQHRDPSPAYVDDAAVVVAVGPPARMDAGAAATVRLTATNTGSTTWTPDRAYRLGSQGPEDNTVWGTGRVELADSAVDPEQEADFAFPISAPAAPGRYDFAWRLVRDGVCWFGETTPAVPIAVEEAAPVPAGGAPVPAADAG